jgi:radical SAM protein with 4Fe4S-binding SPASM domain
VVVWNWTRACNLRCAHCYASAQLGRAPGELDTSEALALIEEFADLRVPALILSGGEPLARPDALELLAAARQRGLRCTLSTNGTLINEARAQRIAEAGVVYVGVSIDGPRDLHDRWRGKQGAYDRTMAAVGHLRRLGVRVGLRFTLHAGNVDHVPDVLDLVEEHGLQRICFYHLVPAGRGSGLDPLHLDRQRTRATLDLLLDRSRRWLAEGRDVELLTVDNHSDGPYAVLWADRWMPERASAIGAMLTRNGGNRSGRAIVAIDPQGKVHPDQFSPGVVLGDVREARFSAIWRDGNDELHRLRDRAAHLRGRCATCRWLSLCNGNLRARAAAAGDPWGPDPDCVLTDAEVAAVGAG